MDHSLQKIIQPGATTAPVLSASGLNAWYGESHVLHDMNFVVREGEVVTLLGRNGAGKTTTLKSIMGVLERRTGSVKFRSEELIKLGSSKIARMGVGWVPEERGIFASLDVEENLLLPPAAGECGFTVEQIYDMFPNLRARRHSPGDRLSGGEQQMLAIGRVLRTGSRLLLLDEPTEGLAPVIVEQIGQLIQRLKGLGYTIILVEQNLHAASAVADRHYIVEQGRVVDEIANSALGANMARLQNYLGV